MKSAGFIIGIIATSAVAILALQCVILCTFEIAILFAIMAVVSGYMTYFEYQEKLNNKKYYGLDKRH